MSCVLIYNNDISVENETYLNIVFFSENCLDV